MDRVFKDGIGGAVFILYLLRLTGEARLVVFDRSEPC